MKIYFNGDSNVRGEELANLSDSVAGCLARKLNAEYRNDAVTGASNDLIYDSTMKFLESDETPDLVVIGWTEFSRVQWFLADAHGKGQLWEINHLGVGIPVPDRYQSRYQYWKEHVQRDGYWSMIMGSYWHNKIYNVHCLLEHKKIPHLFFNAFVPFFLPSNEQQFSWNNTFLSPYTKDLIFTDYCINHGYKEITPGYMHFNEEAHNEYAEIMFNHIKAHNIL